jgi:hypothetical protein
VHDLVDLETGVRLSPAKNRKIQHQLVHADRRGRREPSIWAHTADAVPGVALVRGLTFAFIRSRKPGMKNSLVSVVSRHASGLP